MKWAVVFIVVAANGCSGSDDAAERDADSDDATSVDDTFAPDIAPPVAWWLDAPRDEQDEQDDSRAPRTPIASVECPWTDPYVVRFECGGGCHYLLGTISGVVDVQNDYVANDGGQTYVVLDQRSATFVVSASLTQFPPFTDGTRALPAAPSGTIEIAELAHGVPNLFTQEDPPELLFVDDRYVLETPAWARLPASGIVVVALQTTANLAHPDRWEVTNVLGLTPDGLVDFSVLEGTRADEDPELGLDVPTEPLDLAAAAAFLQAAVGAGGRCRAQAD